MNGGTTMTNKHNGSYEIHPVFHDLVEGLRFDLRVGEPGLSTSTLYPNVDHEALRRHGDPTQRNYIRIR